MPLIGLYIAAASLVCSVAMAGDLARGILRKKLWFPSKFFTMNAASLTLLAVVKMLTVDLTAAMWGPRDGLAKLTSTVFLTTAMGNFLISLASMDDKAVLMNVIGLGILVITVIVDECMQIGNGVILREIWPQHFVVLISMFVLLLTFGSSALAVPTTNSYLNVKYNELHKTISTGETEGRIPNNGVMKEVVEKYWVMAVTSSPQFVMARSPACTASGAICLFTALTLVNAHIRMYSWTLWHPFFTEPNSSYQWILTIQLIGVAIGTVVQSFRGFTAISFNCSNSSGSNLQQNGFKVENYWVQRLVEWKERPLAFHIRWVRGKKVVHDTKNLVIDMCIRMQCMMVVTSKGILFISIVFTRLFFQFFYNCKRWMIRNPIHGQGTNHGSSEPQSVGSELDLNSYVLLLEGEAKLPKIVLKNMRDDFSKVVEMGTQHQPKNLLELLRKSSSSFLGVTEFDSSQVPNILPQLPSCWSLPMVTLTSIAIALPNIQKEMVDRLLNSVSEGLSYASLVEESLLTTKDDLLNTKHAAIAVWVGVELKRKWLDKDLREMALKGKASKEILQSLADIAEKVILEFEKTMTGSFVKNPLSWPWKVIATNLMYMISQTILKDHESNDEQTDVELFEQLSIMIADILGACLTNLPRAITMKCYCSAVEEREKSVRHAARLLGETQEILEILGRHELPCLTSDQMAYIDEWRRAFMEHRIPSADVASSNNQIAASDLAGELSIDIK